MVLKTGDIAHLLLLDFHITVSEENGRLCNAILAELNLSGNLFDSGKSYHFISDTLFKEEEFLNVLYNCLLFAPIIDRAWIAHQLIEKSCCLRISKKYNRFPILINTK